MKANITMPLGARSKILRNISFLILFALLLMWGCGGGGDAATSRLTWQPPTTYANSNNTPLRSSDLKGYRVYYRTDTGYYSSYNSYFVPSPSTSVSTQSLNLSQGKYYFVVTAVDMMDVASDFSNEVSVQIN
jgi:hypothetical protein